MPDALLLDGIEHTKALLAHHHAFGDHVHPGGGRAAAERQSRWRGETPLNG